jgi:hypothetical protein
MNSLVSLTTNYELPGIERVYHLGENKSLDELCDMASDLRDKGHGSIVTYSKRSLYR